MRWLACSLLPNVHSHAMSDTSKWPWPEATTFSYLWSSVENQCLMAWTRYAASLGLKHLSLHFDGIGIVLEDEAKADDFASASARAIYEYSGYHIDIVPEKPCRFFLAALTDLAYATRIPGMDTDSMSSLLGGNRCIPMCSRTSDRTRESHL